MNNLFQNDSLRLGSASVLCGSTAQNTFDSKAAMAWIRQSEGLNNIIPQGSTVTQDGTIYDPSGSIMGSISMNSDGSYNFNANTNYSASNPMTSNMFYSHPGSLPSWVLPVALVVGGYFVLKAMKIL